MSLVHGTRCTEISEIPERSSSSLNDDERIAFYGWSDKNLTNMVFNMESDAKKYVVNVSDYYATEDRNFYALFVTENVYDKATNNKYFVFTPVTTGSNEYRISANPDYVLSGKITLPATYIDDNKNEFIITTIGNFSAAKCTHVFFMKTSASGKSANYKIVGEKAFSMSDN
jgi:hypothetical protein